MGIMIRYLKWYWLIAGYNTMTAEKKKKVDIEGLSRLMGLYCFVGAGVFLLAGILLHFQITWAVLAAIVLYGIATIMLLIKAQSYDGNNYNEQGEMKKSVKWIVGSVIAVPLIGVAALMYMSSQSSEIVIEDDYIQITGMYGLTLEYQMIQSVELVDILPNIERRTNGSSVGSIRKGNFRLENIGAAKLFVNVNNPPFIEIVSDRHHIFINDSESITTEQLYLEITTKLK
ncbi:hypothetical protein BHF68_03660 [Desulfuribacillus alkaliarsenatis]|uniref:Bacterial Pleckstrin homology domain-containing protein n=2 Tax=Desulfuribacillus alkaliarsenatis TaxID=766136 RepID=A0A1E5G3K5_9FIRM|nr:hypothetical protein BHF68_03660 [Desulfuribacillus alkaliarsenatis]